MARRTRQAADAQAEIEELRARLAEAEDTVRAIHEGAIDAIVVSGPTGDRVFSVEETASVYRRMVETMNEAALTVSQQRTVLFCNKRFAEMLGRPGHRIVGQPLEEMVLPEDRPALSKLLSRLRRRPGNARLRFVSEGGAVLPLQVWGSFLPPPDGPMACLAATDLTQLETYKDLVQRMAQQQEDLQRYTAELKRSNEDLEQFAYVASHDLQEPLRMIRMFAQLLDERYRVELSPRAQEYLAQVTGSAARMSELVSGLLEFARAGTTKQEGEVGDAREAVAKAVENCRVAINETHAKVHIGKLPPAVADPIKFVQVLQNLLANAVKFRRPEVQPEVSIRARPEVGQWEFAVGDNGLGIDPRYANKIFLVFQRLHSRDSYAGAGIGLSICKRLVERHGGQIRVESQPGQGSTFYFTWPAGKAKFLSKATAAAGGSQIGDL